MAHDQSLTKRNQVTLRDLFTKMSKQLTDALPRHMSADRMIRIAMTSAQRVPRLLECDPLTVVGAVMQAAQLGLEPDNVAGLAYLVPFWASKNNRYECQLIPGYKGLLQLARRSREIAAVDARVVKFGDVFEFEFGTSQYLRHRPAQTKIKDGKPDLEAGIDQPTVAAYFVAFYANAPKHAGAQFHVMMRPELERAKQFTSSRNRERQIVGPWIEHPDAMFQKTVIRRGAKLLPFSVELQTAIGLDERVELGRSQNLGALGADALGLDFTPEADDDELGQGGDIAADLLAAIAAHFDALQVPDARRTVKVQEFRGRPTELLEWLKAELMKAGKALPASTSAPAASDTKPAAGDTATANGDTKPAVGETKAPAADTTKSPAKKREAGKFKI